MTWEANLAQNLKLVVKGEKIESMTNFMAYSLFKITWKFVAENHTENFAALKITLKNNIKEGFTENYTEKRPLLFRNAKNG